MADEQTPLTPRFDSPHPQITRSMTSSRIHRGSFFHQSDIDDEVSSFRTEILRELRSERLIGSSKPLARWADWYVPDDKLRQLPSKIRDFYEHQNCVIQRFEEIDALFDAGVHQSLLEEYGDDIGVAQPTARRQAPVTVSSQDGRGTSPAIVKFWINVNLLANFVLLGGKAAVFFLTSSLSVIASLIDSILDLLSTLIIWVSATIADRRDWKTRHLYPVGRNRLEPIGVLVFSVVMVVSFLKVADEAVERLWNGDHEVVNISGPSFTIMLLTVLIKVALYFCCRSINSSAVQALAADAMTDIMFNTFSIIFPLCGHYFDIWWLDPLGALLLSFYVVFSWSQVAMEHIDNLTGSAADPIDRQQILYLCTRFSARIKYITRLNAYHAGDRLMCEVDLLLDNSLNMRDAHDLAETLQYALETLPIIERAFVHLDYRRENFTGHLQL